MVAIISEERYEELKEQLVWVKFCHADREVRIARERETSRVEYEPVLVKLGEAISKGFAATGFITVHRLQNGIIRELKKMGYEVYDRGEISYDVAYVRPHNDSETEITAPLVEVWFGEYVHEPSEVGIYTGKVPTQIQIEQVTTDIGKAEKNLQHREVVSEEPTPLYEEGNFDEIARTLGVEEGELVLRRKMSQRYLSSDWCVGELELVRVIRTSSNHFDLEPPFEFPYFSGEQKELKRIIETMGIADITLSGRSGIEARNRYTIKPARKTTNYNIKVIDEMMPAYRGTRYMTERDNAEVMDYCQEDVKIACEIVSKAKDILERKRSERFFEKFQEKTLDSTFAVISEGGYEEKVEVPKNSVIECFRIRTANTQDHRANISHTYDVGYIDIESARRNIKDGKLHIDIPQEYMGKMIGVKGVNINAITQTLREKGVNVTKIILHPKTQEEIKLKLDQIKEATEKNKTKGQGHED